MRAHVVCQQPSAAYDAQQIKARLGQSVVLNRGGGSSPMLISRASSAARCPCSWPACRACAVAGDDCLPARAVFAGIPLWKPLSRCAVIQ